MPLYYRLDFSNPSFHATLPFTTFQSSEGNKTQHKFELVNKEITEDAAAFTSDRAIVTAQNLTSSRADMNSSFLYDS